MTSCRSFAEVRQRHRVPRERDRDRRAQPHPFGVLGGDGERDERVVLGLEAEHAVVPDVLESRVDRAHVARILERARGEDLHALGSGILLDGDETTPGIDQREVGERLREVAEVLAGGRVDLLGVEVQRTGERQQLLEQRAGAFDLADDARAPTPARTSRS